MIPCGSLIDNYAFDSSGSARIVVLCSFMATLRLADSCTPKGGRSGRDIGRRRGRTSRTRGTSMRSPTVGRTRRPSGCASGTWAPTSESGVPRRGGLRFVLVLSGLRRLDGDTIASATGCGRSTFASALARRICWPSPRHGLANRGGPDGDRLGTLGRQADLLVASGLTTRAAAEALASPCSTARTGSGTPSSSSVLSAWTVARLTSNGLAASSCETASFRAVFARRPPARRVSRAAVTARRPSVGIAASRVCQMRRELEADWREFQGQASVPEAGDPRRARV